MNSYFKIGLAFVSGLAVGAFVMKKYIDYKEDREYYYEEDFEEDIKEDIKEDTKEDTKEDIKEEDFEECNVNEDLKKAFDNEYKLIPSKRESRIDYSKIKSVNDETYTRLLDELKYRVDSEAEVNTKTQEESEQEYIESVVIDRNKPYIIKESEFKELEGFESDDYTLYADGYLTDSYGLPVPDEDVDGTIGSENLEYFLNSNLDQIWIRNENIGMDFSIIKDIDNFVDVAPARIKRMVGL